MSELAETDLRATLRQDGPLDATEIARLGERLRAALDVLHGLELVHCDVREENVLRVDGDWRLADLGGVVRIGEPIVVRQRSDVYRPEGVELRSPAARESDLYALGVVLRHAAEGLPQ